jgi:predicted nucleic acid-binding protein
MSLGQRENAEALLDAYLRLYPKILPVRSQHLRHAASIAGREDINVRAADALHLAIAKESEATICTLDLKMHQAAGILKIAALKP